MSRPAAAVIAALKSPGAPRPGISRPFNALLEQALAELGIHLQVEDIAGGLLLFWEDLADFARTTRALTMPETDLAAANWDKGAMLWRLTLLKPPEFTEVQRILGSCREVIIALFGPRSAPEVTGAALSFRTPADVNLLKAFWRRYQTQQQSPR